MGAFASELLEAKSEADIQRICNEHHFVHESYSPCADPDIYRLNRKRRWIFKISDEFVPSYASWLLEYAHTLRACLQFYAICLPIARKDTKNAKATDLFTVLHYAHKLHQQMVTEVYRNYEWIPIQDIRERKITVHLRDIPKFPLVSLFEGFQNDEGYKLQNLYGYTFKQMRRRGEQSPPQSEYHYWKNPLAADVSRELLWGYTMHHRADDDQYILTWNQQALAVKCLEILDRHIEEKLGNVKYKMDSVAGTAMLLTDNIESALSLWIFMQVQAQTDYRICKMCGRLFIAGSQKGKKYCDLHKKHEINYYNKTIGRLEKTCSAETTE
jgi:hypothetical protein